MEATDRILSSTSCSCLLPSSIFNNRPFRHWYISLTCGLCRSSRRLANSRLPFSCFSPRCEVPVSCFSCEDTRPVFLGLNSILPESIALLIFSSIDATYWPVLLDRKLLYGDSMNLDKASLSSD